MGFRTALGLLRDWRLKEAPQNPNAAALNVVGSHQIFIRPNTPDLLVAKVTLDGEFRETIAAASPLRHNFIVDAGGYIGTAAIAFASAFPKATVLTIEPSLENFAVLKKNTQDFKNIIALNAALAPTSGKRQLRNRATGEWGFSIVERPADRPDAVVIQDVSTVTIPDLIRRYRASGIDILKLDIEGGEYEIFNAATPWISSVRVLIAELHDRIVPGCQKVFERATVGRSNAQSGEKILSVAHP